MPLSLSNKVIQFAPLTMGAGESTQMQYTGTGTGTSTQYVGVPYWEFADYTTTGSVPTSTQILAGGPGDFGSPRMSFRAFVTFKAYTGATGSGTSTTASLPVTTAGPLMTLEVATSTAYSPTYILDWTYLPPAFGSSTGFNATSTGQASSSTVVQVFGPSKMLFGVTPNNAGAQFGRINFYANGAAPGQSSSTGIDAILQAF